MPNWKVKGYNFYFKKGEVLEIYKPAHIHVETEKGEIQFWLENCEIKKENMKLSKNEVSKITKIVQEQKSMFLEKWNDIKKKAEQTEIESSSSSENEGLGEITNTLSNLDLDQDLEEQNLNQIEIKESSHYQENETSSSSFYTQRSASFLDNFIYRGRSNSACFVCYTSFYGNTYA